MQINQFKKWLASRFGGLTFDALIAKADLPSTVLTGLITTGSLEFDSIISSFGSASVAAFDREQVMPRAGVLSHLFVKPAAQPAEGNPITVTVLKNGVATALTVVLPVSANAVISDTAHTVNVVAGDLISVQFTPTDPEASHSLAGTAFSALLK